MLTPQQHNFYFISDVIGPPTNFALVTGLASALPLMFAGFFSGFMAESCSRKNVMGISIIGMAVCTLFTGFATSFIQILILRLMLGITGGFFVPSMLGLIIDYCPEKLRTQGIAATTSGVLLGLSITQVTDTFIAMIGWRNF